jgi:hypothetical protein
MQQLPFTLPSDLSINDNIYFLLIRMGGEACLLMLNRSVQKLQNEKTDG